MVVVLRQGVLVEILPSTQVTTAFSEVFPSVSEFSDFLGDFAYLSLTLNFQLHRNLWMVIGRIFGLVDLQVTRM